jgi:hypothetical protein
MAEVERRIEDVVLRQQTFSRLKHELIRQAMQLSILCDCDVQLFVHSARVGAQGVQGQLSSTQFSSDNAEALMEYVLEHPPAERFGVEDYWHTFKASAPTAAVFCCCRARGRAAAELPPARPRACPPRGSTELPDRSCSDCHADQRFCAPYRRTGRRLMATEQTSYSWTGQVRGTLRRARTTLHLRHVGRLPRTRRRQQQRQQLSLQEAEGRWCAS